MVSVVCPLCLRLQLTQAFRRIDHMEDMADLTYKMVLKRWDACEVGGAPPTSAQHGSCSTAGVSQDKGVGQQKGACTREECAEGHSA